MTTAATVNGCHNRKPYAPAVPVLDRGVVVASMPFRQAKDCQYTLSKLGLADQRCAGCCWRVDPAPPAPVMPPPAPPMKDLSYRPW